jgi:hypothetical protein
MAFNATVYDSQGQLYPKAWDDLPFKKGNGKKDRNEPLVSNWRSRLDGLTPIFDGPE